MANDEVAFQNQTGCGARLRRIGRSICNTEKGEFLNRTPGSWVKICVFYTIFYSCLAGFFAALMAGFFTTIDPRYPTQRRMYSLLKGNPGMGFKPMKEMELTLIKFDSSNNKTYGGLVKNLNEFMNKHTSEQNGSVVECRQVGMNTTLDKVCKAPPASEYGECTFANEFGYREGKPCVLLKINKLIDWYPEAFGADNSSDTEDQAKRRAQATKLLPGGHLPTDHIGITCQGENSPDEDMIGPVQIFPPIGFSFKNFPYMNQLGYRAPIVFAKFDDLKKGVIIQVWCKMWAKNIKHHKNDKAGSVHFELLVD